MSRDFPKRVFIAINIPKDIQEELASFKQRWPSLPARWVPSENLHLTLAFLGNTGEKELERVKEAVQKVAGEVEPFPVFLERISYGPPKRTPPSLVWAEGKAGKEIAKLKHLLDRELEKASSFQAPQRKYIPHVTLSRIQKMKWRRINPDERPRVKEEIGLSFEVSSLEVMESKLKRSGAEYSVLSSHPFKNE